jgi:glycosyltransferase involved in cell wall biosynthesis
MKRKFSEVSLETDTSKGNYCPMRIVLLNQFFWPDTVATAQHLTDLAVGLAQENEVTVICSDTGAQGPNQNTQLGPNIQIIRTRGFRFSHRGPDRIASYLSYLAGTVWQCFRLPRADVYFTLTTPPILSPIGSVFAALRGGRHLIWEMDVYPDIACDLGYLKHQGILDRLVGAILDWSRRRAAGLIALGEDMKARLVAHGVPEEKIHVAEIWSDGREITPLPLSEGPLVILYSGNLGLAHEIDTVLGAMERLRNRPDFRFVFVGGGPKRPKLEAACREKNIGNVEFRPYCPRENLGESLSEGHIGLVTQLPQTIGSLVPSKMYGIMAAGRPFLYIGPGGSTPAQHIDRFQCGWKISLGDVDGLEQLLLLLKDNRHLIAEAGVRARLAFEQNFDRSIGVERILRIIGAKRHSGELVSKLTPSAVGD